MRPSRALWWISVILLAAGQVGAGEKDTPGPGEQTARAFVRALAKEDFKAAGKDFDEAMQKALPMEKLKATWAAAVGQLGPFQKQLDVRTERSKKYEIVYVTCRFEKKTLDLKIVFADRKITGFFFVETRGAHDYEPPAYARPESFCESDVTVGAGEWALPGTLTLPKGDGPFPAVVLVHGSGPQDRDETIGPNKVFRDLAWGLASQGVAVLRYEKRTREHGPKLAKNKDRVTVKEEVIDDALAAAALLRKQRAIDGKRVFVLGHSLGGMMAPQVGTRDPNLAGLVILAGTTRPLEDVIVEQFEYIFSLGGGPSAKQKEQLEKIKKQVARVKDRKLTPDTPASELPLGAPAPYWLSLRGYDPAATAARFKRPMLILQGERDYQVTMADFAGWKKALAGRKDVRLKSYPKLNHLFMEGEGKAKPEEYGKAGHVAKEVIDEIARWIKSR